MKKVFRKNQLIITALAAMVIVAGYLNFSGEEISNSDMSAKIAKQAQKLSKDDNSKQDVSQTESSENQDEEALEGATYEISDEGDLIDINEGEDVASKENPGEAVMVSNTIGADYFTNAKLNREQTRAKNKETLMEIVNNEALGSADKKAAVDEIAQITKYSEKESDAEILLEAKGFSGSMVSINEGNVDVVVDATELTDSQMAQIVDIVKRKTGISAEKIVITPVSVDKK